MFYYNNANFIIDFLSEDNFSLKCRVDSVRHTFVFDFYLNKTKCKRPEVNTELSCFVALMDNGRAFSSLDDMACNYQCSDQF